MECEYADKQKKKIATAAKKGGQARNQSYGESVILDKPKELKGSRKEKTKTAEKMNVLKKRT